MSRPDRGSDFCHISQHVHSSQQLQSPGRLHRLLKHLSWRLIQMIHCDIFDPNACQTCVDESCNKISECIICRTLRCMQTLGLGHLRYIATSRACSAAFSFSRCASRVLMLRLWTGATHSHFEERPTRCLATLGSSRSVAHGEMDASSSGVMQTKARAASWNESSTLPVKLRCVR